MNVGGFGHLGPLLSCDAKQAVQHVFFFFKKKKKTEKTHKKYLQGEQGKTRVLLSPRRIKNWNCSNSVPQFVTGAQRAREIGMSAVLRRFSPSANQLGGI